MTAPCLKIFNLHVHYGGIHALKGLSLEVSPGEIVVILGANGSGKTTTLHTVSGLLSPSQGVIEFFGRPIQGHPAHEIVSYGLAQSPEGRWVFPDLTVGENLEMGAYLRRDREKLAADEAFLFDLFPILKERKKQLAGTLSGGEQQMLAISRAYMSGPKLLLLDEPSLGIAPILSQKIFAAIQKINAQGTSILLVEQNAHAGLSIAHRGYVLATGSLQAHGSAKELREDEQVRKAYLGRGA